MLKMIKKNFSSLKIYNLFIKCDEINPKKLISDLIEIPISDISSYKEYTHLKVKDQNELLDIGLRLMPKLFNCQIKSDPYLPSQDCSFITDFENKNHQNSIFAESKINK